MFYYGLDFHDLASNFVLNISAFIVVCEAFLRIRPHFGLWLKTFNVKPKVVRGSQAECGGAMVGKMANVLWNFNLNTSAFIIVCEVFLRIKPHSGLCLKIFNVKPKVVGGQQAECGGAMVGKMPNITWLEGSFVETIKGWQSGWFYITEPRDPTWVAAPSSDLASPHDSPPGKRRACPGVVRES